MYILIIIFNTYVLYIADNFKSLDANKDKEKLKEDSKFDQQREATIAQALQAKEGRSKTFAVGTGKQIQV